MDVIIELHTVAILWRNRLTSGNGYAWRHLGPGIQDRVDIILTTGVRA
jgi:hypothetical protein